MAWLPIYAPDLNPVETVRSRTGYADLTNFALDNLSKLEGSVPEPLSDTQREQLLLAAFISQSVYSTPTQARLNKSAYDEM